MKTPDEHYRAKIDSMTQDEALEFVSQRVKESIEDTRRTRMKVEASLTEMEERCSIISGIV
jgi:hypothetical protein